MNRSVPIIAANWKMYKTPQEGYRFARMLATKAMNLPATRLIIFPPFTGLLYISELLKGTSIELGAQNLHWADQGAYTGEISASMLLASGCAWVIVGHSERRHLFRETDEDISQKVEAALSAGLKVILCIGERIEEREADETDTVLSRQLRAGLSGVNEFPVHELVIAYEPVWAIGTGLVATSEQAATAHRAVRGILTECYPGLGPDEASVIYGGSVNGQNAEELIQTEGVDGFLIGGASLALDEYCRIAEIAQARKKVLA